MEVDLIIKHGSELLTLGGAEGALQRELHGALGVIENESMAINDGKILDIGNDSEISETYEGNEIDATGKLVLPGFIDAHTHLVYAGARENELSLKVRGISYRQIARRGGGIHSTVRKTRNASKSDLKDQAKGRLDEMLRHGTTTAEVKSGYGLNTEEELKLLETIKELDEEHPIDLIPTFLGAHEIPQRYENAPEKYVEEIIEEMIPKVANRGLAKFCDVFVEEGVFTVEQGRKILEAGKKHGLTPRLHADELSNLRGAELAAQVDAISASHLLHASKKGLQLMAKKGIIGIYLPASCMALLSETFPNGREIIDSGLSMALASDLNPNCWVTNLQTVLTLAVYFMRITPAEAITAATINAAASLGFEKEVGSLKKGKRADIIIMNVPNHRWLGYKMGVNLVDTVVKNGKVEWRSPSALSD
ncbi:MAG: imidazolonepropionase [Candidatus Korarchaeota archaeon]|nr:imidazolonepropionase [Candidatus Korarchaeota archaeon]NIU84495.1 imidazolonepropionase [Candidatus Thorarchaeota archaeon]NIW14562.1 imidazolonepropionase [Candidatus Thorarchaeota archaeon]NIW52634.1 imidazolonepropionase [Candidatus Korarchaeota archaeon]